MLTDRGGNPTVLFAGCLILLAVGALGIATAGAQESHIGKLTGHASDGQAAFPRYCNGCHGVRGNGAGTFAPYLDPRPRDFTAAVYKCRSTPTGSTPTDTDLYNTMTRGLVTTSMPPWAALTQQTRADIVAYLKTFSPRFATDPIAAPIAVQAEESIAVAGIKHGGALYQSLQCASCHGVEGHGDGPKASTLLDNKNRPIVPYDFTATERFKCGSTNRDLYVMLMTGMDGTPMVSYADKLAPEDAWDLVHFVRTLQTKRKGEENRVMSAAGGQKLLILKK